MPVHDVNHQNCYIAERTSSVSQVTEALVARGVDDEETRQLQSGAAKTFHHLALLLDHVDWDVGRSDLLCDASSLAILNVGLPQFVQDLGLPHVNMTQHTNNRCSEDLSGPGCLVTSHPVSDPVERSLSRVLRPVLLLLTGALLFRLVLAILFLFTFLLTLLLVVIIFNVLGHRGLFFLLGFLYCRLFLFFSVTFSIPGVLYIVLRVPRIRHRFFRF